MSWWLAQNILRMPAVYNSLLHSRAKRLIPNSTKNQKLAEMFLGMCFLNILNCFFFSLSPFVSLPFFFSVGVWRSGLEGRRGRLPGLCSPQSTVKRGEGFLPTQPSVTFYEQQDPRTAAAQNLGKGCVYVKKTPWCHPLLELSRDLFSFIYWQVSSSVLRS